MKKLYFLAVAGWLAVIPASAQSKFDAGSRVILDQYRVYVQNPSQALSPALYPVSFQEVSRAGGRATVYVTLTPGHTAEEIEARGFEILVDLDDMILANGTFDDIAALEDCDFVKAVSFGEQREVKLDISRTVTGVASIHEGVDIQGAFRGTGVITGIYDTGMDPNHANFRKDDGTTRLGRLWHMTSNDGRFTEYATPERITSFVTDNRTETHGTHTMGCMAGSFNRRGGGSVAFTNDQGRTQAGARFLNPYYGMAPDATIAAGCGSLYDPNITAAVEQIINYAEAEGKPVVINLSIGSNIGPHDGTDEVTATLDRLGKRAIICIAAGNEADTHKSIAKTFTAADNTISTIFANETGSSASGYIDIYSNSSTPFTVTPVLIDKSNGSILYSMEFGGGNETTAYLTTSNYTQEGYIHDAQFDRAFNQSSVTMTSSKNSGTNNRYSVRLIPQLSANRVSNPNNNIVFGFKVTGQAGQLIHITTNSSNAEFLSFGLDGYTEGNGDFSVSSMACGHNTICVGAWNTRYYIPALGRGSGATIWYQNEGANQDSIAGYSSWGVLADGRKLPLICAPGTGIISSISSFYYNNMVNSNADYAYELSANQTYLDRSNHWHVEQGTSMATPIVAGSIALWLEAKPNLTVEECRDLIIKYAIRDEYVTNEPNQVQWGYGKFDALGAMKELVGQGVNNVAADAAEGIIATPTGDGTWNILVPGADRVELAVYSVDGRLMATASGYDSSATLDTGSFPAGVYILTANGAWSTRVVVR